MTIARLAARGPGGRTDLRVGLLFVAFESGSLMQITGRAEYRQH